VAARIAAWTPRDEALRPVAVEALHLTLAFLGERDEDDAAAAGSVLAGVARPVRALALGEAVWLPARRPRALAVSVADEDGALHALQADLVEALAGAIGFAASRRPFLAHVTAARVRGRAAVAGLASRPLEPVGGPERFAAAGVALMRSRLDPAGARYETLERVAL